MADTKKLPKFWFELDGFKYGGRFTTIAEQAACMVEIERLTNGNFEKWTKSEDITIRGGAFFIQAAVYLSRVIVQWPIGMEPIEFLESDDADMVMRYWEAYSKASADFRKPGDAKGAGEADLSGRSSADVVSGSI